MLQLAPWEGFYTIIGSAAAALTGLMFVAVTLLTRGPLRGTSDTYGAFNTPNIVHFCTALGIAALLSAPWPVLWPPELLLGLAGLAGLWYMRIVLARAHRQTDYRPVLEDELWHIVFPLVAYSALVVAAPLCSADATPALFLTGAATVLFLFIGIHNAWDNVTFLLLHFPSPEGDGADSRPDADLAAGRSSYSVPRAGRKMIASPERGTREMRDE